MNQISVGQQVIGGQVVVATVDTGTGNLKLTFPQLGDASGPEVITVTPSTTVGAVEALVKALVAVAPTTGA